MISKQPPHNLTMIPGPIEFDDAVLSAMSHPSIAHTAPPFVETFQSALKSLRTLFGANHPAAQPFVIAGGGTLGWDISAANFIEAGDAVLLLNTGFFSASWADCLKTYGAEVTELGAEIGGIPTLAEIEAALSSRKYHAITITHVDTSTAVVQDVQKISELVHKVSPETLVLVDGVCSVGVEPLKFDEWKLDYVLTASQKAIGAPAGLSISVASERALKELENRKTPVPGYFHNVRRWLPIMRAYESGKPAYFSTPAVQNVYALKTTLDQIAPNAAAVQERWKIHAAGSDKLKDTLNQLGLKLVAKDRSIAAHGLSAVYLPDGWTLQDLLPKLLKAGFVVAGGILPPVAAKYFRIGHMGVSVTKYGHLDKLIAVLPEIIQNGP